MMAAREDRAVEPYRLRPMVAADLEEVMEIERLSFSAPWSETTFRSLLGRPNAALLVAEEPGAEPGRRIAGYAVVWAAGAEAELGDLGVHPDRRRRGIGRALLEEAMRAAVGLGARAIFLEVRAGNDAARRLYEEAGFQTVGLRPAYYVAPVEDAVVMRRSLGRGVR